MRILHLSDFHIDFNNLEDLKNYVINPLKRDLQKSNNEKKIDMVAFSGDLVDKGGLSFNHDIELAFLTFQEEVIEPLLNAIHLPLDRFFFVPGNHDIIRSADKEHTELGLLHLLKNSEKVNSFIDSGEEDGIKRVLPFKSFERAYFYNFNGHYEYSNYQSTFRWNLESFQIGVTCFNSSWRCYDSQKDYQNIIIGERQVTRPRDIISDCDIKIGIIHHPLDELAPFEAKQIEGMLIKDYDILLFGHVHEGNNYTKSNILGSTVISVAPSNWTTNVRNKNIDFMNGYSLIDFIKGSHVEITHKKYSHTKESFVPNTDLGDDSGKTIYNFPTSSEVARKEDELAIIEKIKEVHLEFIDQHLITYETDTLAPKKIDDMFVLPRIVQKREKTIDEEIYTTDDKNYSIVDICEFNRNILLVGVKESGKTILIDKLLLEFSNYYHKYKKIPVYINFEETSSNNIDILISKFLSLGILKIRNEILNNHDIILLVDNLKFEKKYERLLGKLELFLKEYTNVSLIATCTTSTEEEIPVEALNTNFLEMLQPMFIKGFQTKEIRELMTKWFSKNNKYINHNDGLEKIIRTFGTLNIPRTPLAVSMFLWIIEKQENYAPVNNAQMIENFLERLFSKTTNNQIYFSEFNYKNKERLLTEIAMFMYKQNSINYKVNYQDLRTFIFENLKRKKFDFDEEILLKDFIKKGIFSVEKEGNERFVRFKLTCFFQFFLMKNILNNPDFKEEVLLKENYLHFIDELDYYSGLKMDDTELLELVVERMDDEYSLLMGKIENIQYSYDNQFETLKTIVYRLNHADLEKITSSGKETEEEIEKRQDQQLSNINNEKFIEKKDIELNPIVRLDRLWKLSALILKNTEETTKENIKSEAFIKILRCSMAFAGIYKFILKKFLEEAEIKDNEDELEQYKIMSKMLPFFHEILMYQTLGSGKLSIVLEERIEEIIENEDISDFEKFLCVFIYADLKGKNRMRYISLLIKNIKRYYIKDMILLKLVEYYKRKDTNKTEEDKYKNFLGDLITLDDGQNNSKRDYHRKGKVIAHLENIKKEKLLQTN
ncbi:metallophosphoesterase [Cytobacillus gottheilii]|uniref:metallophosphoesterase n=1 Tax=Cytobacillus gottheilii TaxID=859144 RepID=UPI0024947EA4|nr:metallophosphoesterase [Cytobacillus gottheilii]